MRAYQKKKTQSSFLNLIESHTNNNAPRTHTKAPRSKISDGVILFLAVTGAGLEPATLGLIGRCSPYVPRPVFHRLYTTANSLAASHP